MIQTMRTSNLNENKKLQEVTSQKQAVYLWFFPLIFIFFSILIRFFRIHFSFPFQQDTQM